MPAHYVVVDGLRLPAQLGGHPVLDFCNTLTGWDGREPWDYLQSYDHLATWAAFVELLPEERIESLRRHAGTRVSTAEALLAQARDLRSRLYTVLCNGSASDAFDLVADDVNAATAELRLRPAGQIMQWAIGRESGLAAPIAAVAWSAGQLLTSPELANVRACPGTGCGWLFLDSRGRRRWCTMATCGNREKVKRFANRRQARPQSKH
jgi:predicted RNA-binding Zn ribbon-like protein